MKKVISEKFDPNPDLADQLIATGSRSLNANMFLGIGAMLHNREIKEKSYKVYLGLLLPKKRDQFTAKKHPVHE